MVTSLQLIASPQQVAEPFLRAQLDQVLIRFDASAPALLIQVPQVPLHLLEREVARSRGYFAYPPHGPLYLSAALSALGIRTRVLDLNFVTLREAQAEHANPDSAWRLALNEAITPLKRPFVGVSFMFDPTFAQVKAVCQQVRLLKPDAFLVVGGVAASSDPGVVLAAGDADLVVSHEGEAPLSALYAYKREQSTTLPMNLSFLGPDGALLNTPLRTGGPVDLDISEEYAKISVEAYSQVGSLSNFSRMNGVDVPFCAISSRRGCRAHCSFCSVRSFNGKRVRVRDRHSVVREMEVLYQKHGIRHFDWLDDDLLYDGKDARKLFQLIGQRLPNITWAVNNGLIASAIDAELLDAMRDSGCIGYKVGLESGNASVLRNIHKPTNLPKFYRFAQLAKNYPEMFVAVNFIMGFPGERFEQMRDSFAAAGKARLDWNNFYIYQPLKQTELYLAYGGLGSDSSVIEHGKDCQGPRLEVVAETGFNPVRGGAFRDYPSGSRLHRGYDIFDLPPSMVPDKDQLREIWFTFNYVANFLRMPALTTESAIALDNGIRWLEVLSRAYPQDAAMSCVLYYLHARRDQTSKTALATIRDEAFRRLAISEYWSGRDEQFEFSALLDNIIPDVHSKIDPGTEEAEASQN